MSNHKGEEEYRRAQQHVLLRDVCLEADYGGERDSKLSHLRGRNGLEPNWLEPGRCGKERGEMKWRSGCATVHPDP